MVVVQGLLAMLSQRLSQLLNTAFGWATMLLFGKVPQNRQLALSAMSFGSLIWLLPVLGIAFPRVGGFLLSFVPLPSQVDTIWIRLGMLIGAALLPAAIGLIAMRIDTSSKDRRGIRGVLSGYPATPALAITLIMLVVFAPLMQLRQMLRRWSSVHVR